MCVRPPAGDLGQTKLAAKVKVRPLGFAGEGSLPGAHAEPWCLEASPIFNVQPKIDSDSTVVSVQRAS
jgi:hypothetical protein